MQIASKELAPLHLQLDLTIEPTDYKTDFEKTLKDIRNKAQIKGFRKGNAPQHIINKFYGRETIHDIVQKKLQEAIQDFLKKDNLQTLGNFIPVNDDSLEKITTDTSKNYVFKFELGIKPNIEIKGINPEDSYTLYKIEVPEIKIDEAIVSLLKRNGTHENIEGTLQSGDLIYVDVKENDENGVKEGGIQKNIPISFDDIADSSLKNKLNSAHPGDTFNFNIYQLEDKPKAFVNKHILGQNDEETEFGPNFTGVIEKITRSVPATLDATLFEKLGVDTITDEASLREDLRKQYNDLYNNDAVSHMYSNMFLHILDATDVPLPKEFIRKSIDFDAQSDDKKITDEELNSYLKSLKWALIREDLIKKYQIHISREDIKLEFIKKVYGYFGGQAQVGFEFIDNLAERLMKDEKQYEKTAEDLVSAKLFSSIHNDITVVEEPISEIDFSEKVKALNANLSGEPVEG
ncbi:MAG: trigger factor [Saprospiraceae bacterium]